jgi:2-polyprenyl-3-methyl-5-hydroxy-6-metoxy-1,4-benzoquinol methylase
VTGVEVDKTAAERASGSCHEVLNRDLNNPDWIDGISENTFDIILMADVLEHLIDPAELLLQIGPLLRPGGKLVICLPNIVHWITRLKILWGRFDYELGGTLDHTHLRFYTLKTARALIEAAGYEITNFFSVTGGRMSGHARPVWYLLARCLPGIFGWQFLYEAKPAPCVRANLRYRDE